MLRIFASPIKLVRMCFLKKCERWREERPKRFICVDVGREKAIASMVALFKNGKIIIETDPSDILAERQIPDERNREIMREYYRNLNSKIAKKTPYEVACDEFYESDDICLEEEGVVKT